MKKLIYIFSLTLLIAGIVSCTKEYDEINTDKNQITKVSAAEIPYLFSRGLTKGTLEYYFYQLGQNLYSDLYAQYFANIATYFPTDRFKMRSDWLDEFWKSIYTGSAPQFKTIMDQTDPSSAEHAVSNVMWVFIFHRMTDYWGPIPYFKAGLPEKTIPYDPQDKIYDDFFKRLDAADKTLKTHTGKKVFGNFDLVYAGDVDKWRKMCNTLRLRLALRVSNVDPARAKTEAEAAVANGVFTTGPGDDALVRRSDIDDLSNGLAVMSPWNEFRMSAAMESILKGYNDPRLSVYFSPTISSGGTEYHGVRNGLTADQLGTNPINGTNHNSLAGPRWNANLNSSYKSTPTNMMSAAEAYFLRAEGALKGWNMGGTGKELYNTGITTSFNQWGITDVTTIQNYLNSTSTPVALNDFLNSPALTNIPVLYNEANPAVALEQIITQKWLAIYPDGFEGWAEYRRTRFPRLYPVVNSENPDVPAGGVIRRITFLDIEKNTNTEAVNNALTLLGGPDKVSTQLWWDKN